MSSRKSVIPTEDRQSFDDCAAHYGEIVDSAIRASGESTVYFAQLKARLTAHELLGRIVATVLDFGCGIGMSTSALAAAIPQARITGCDTSSESIARARATNVSEQPVFVTFAGGRVPFEQNSFDVVFTSCVFHHIERSEHRAWARELWRVLRPGGSLLLFEHNPYNPLTVRAVRRIPFDRGVILLRPSYTIRMLRDAGFDTRRPVFYFFFPNFLGRFRSLERFMTRLPFGAQYYVHARRPV